AERVLSGEAYLEPSSNDYDWLGGGIYFWENDPIRGLEWARERYGEEGAAVVGAALHLGRSLNLMSRHAHEAVAKAYRALKELSFVAELSLPTNGTTGMKRKLDCAVIQHLHEMRKNHRPEPLRPYDTVRGLFIEGDEVFPGSKLRHKTHIQICVRELRVIKGYFRVFPEHLHSTI
ncbi:MAG: hypothetical protein HQL33_11390, partial [Alphaproteobacteria bacterium]|nr:hypothetical protein [Alphaproteobacteria bacterium]